MKFLGKVVSAMMLLAVLGVQGMCCTAGPTQATDEDMDCCRKMAEDCGNMNMPSQHSCCQEVTSQPAFVITKDLGLLATLDLVTMIPAANELPVESSNYSVFICSQLRCPLSLTATSIEILRI